MPDSDMLMPCTIPPAPPPIRLVPYLPQAANTLKAYRFDWKAFDTFCRDHGRLSLPANAATVAAYVA
jgi:hypothetical protein